MVDRPSWAGTPVGTALPERVFPVRRCDLVRYAGASGDFNPIHWSDRAAAESGLPGVIAHGMLTLALAARAVTDWAGDPAAVVECGARFSKPVLVPDDDRGIDVIVSGVVARTLAAPSVRVDLTVRCGGERVLARARAVVNLT